MRDPSEYQLWELERMFPEMQPTFTMLRGSIRYLSEEQKNFNVQGAIKKIDAAKEPPKPEKLFLSERDFLNAQEG